MEAATLPVEVLVEGEALIAAAARTAGQATEEAVAVAEGLAEAEEVIARVAGPSSPDHSSPGCSNVWDFAGSEFFGPLARIAAAKAIRCPAQLPFHRCGA